jgi:hypothetical protein
MYLSFISRPSFDQAGTLVDAGVELNGNNLSSYIFDIVYIGWAVTLLDLLTTYAWYIYFVVPAYALYRFVSGVWSLFGHVTPRVEKTKRK